MQNYNDKIHIFHHVYLNECGLDIASQQLHLLSTSGLLNHTTKLNIGIVHSNVELLIQFLKVINTYDTDSNIRVFPDEPNLPSDERRTGMFLKKFADESNGDEKILYMHTKGASKKDTPFELSVNYWRQYLEFFNIVNWTDCIDALNKGYDSCGVMWTEATWNSIQKSGKHYAGSFYWIKSQIIKRIPTEHFSDSSKYERYAMEAVPSLIEHKALCLHKLGPQIKNPYHDLIEPKLYVGTKDKKEHKPRLNV